MSLAKAFVSGTVVKAPEKRFTQNDMAIAAFTVNVDKNAQTLIRVSTFGQLAETVSSMLNVNDNVAIEGRLQVNTYKTPSGKDKKVFEITANAVEKMSGNSASVQNQTMQNEGNIVSFEQQAAPVEDLIDEDEIPF
ncbi:MAG: single-stranded DNA-binding protein [Candidatus Gastranaerophilales bacterium]|nr:single-stranded DNA-binding protein [Candidatus Gastranaerophilales bacterium]